MLLPFCNSWLLLFLLDRVSLSAVAAGAESPSASGSASANRIMSRANATSTASAAASTHTIKVGDKSDPHQYSPHSVNASIGDVVVFEFYPRNHSVVQADYGSPCVPATGDIFYSGIFNSFNENNGQLVGPAPTWSLVVNNTEPTFFYCTAIDSCTENGMVGVINPNASMTWDAQYQKALEYPYMLVPGQSAPAEGNGSPTTSSTSTSSPGSSSSTLSTGAIAGIVVGAVAFVAILVALFFVLGRNRVYQQWMSSQDGRTERTARWALFSSQASAAAGERETRKSEMGSTTHPGDQGQAQAQAQSIAMSSPDPTQRAFSPQGNHWSWEAPGYTQQQQQYAQVVHPPTELEANAAGGMNYGGHGGRGGHF